MQSSMSGEEWKVLRDLAADKTIVMKTADKRSSVVVYGISLTIFRRFLDNSSIKTSMKMSDLAKIYF